MYPQKPGQRQLQILIVEDHGLLRKSFYKAFHGAHTVHTAASFKEGLELYQDKTPDIVFLDIHLPDGSGHDLASHIKKHNPAAFVIMATISDAREDVEEARQNGADGFIVKPFNKDRINDTINRYLTLHLPLMQQVAHHDGNSIP